MEICKDFQLTSKHFQTLSPQTLFVERFKEAWQFKRETTIIQVQAPFALTNSAEMPSPDSPFSFFTLFLHSKRTCVKIHSANDQKDYGTQKHLWKCPGFAGTCQCARLISFQRPFCKHCLGFLEIKGHILKIFQAASSHYILQIA
jgi:hypothetical protein